MTDHAHTFLTAQLTEAEAEELGHPYYKAGSSVFICTFCGTIVTGNPALDAKQPRRKA